MGRFWGSNPSNGDDQHHDTSASRPESSPESHPSERRESDERTPLLPRETQHHLDPDDPAVSPYNLLSVRSLRWVSIFLFIITVLWWMILLVATFVSPPGFYTRGGGWFGFA